MLLWPPYERASKALRVALLWSNFVCRDVILVIAILTHHARLCLVALVRGVVQLP